MKCPCVTQYACVCMCLSDLESSDDVNPFKIPEHNDLFQMRNKEKSQRKLVCFI